MKVDFSRTDEAFEGWFIGKFKQPSSRFREIEKHRRITRKVLYHYNEEYLHDFLQNQEFSFLLQYFLSQIINVINENGPMDQYIFSQKLRFERE